MMRPDKKSEFWETFLIAAEVEPRNAYSIRGASGFNHPVVSVGVDDQRRRVVIISGESDARSAALAYGDIQATMPSLKVMMVRPIVINLSEAAKLITDTLGSTSLFGNREPDVSIGHNKIKKLGKDDADRFLEQLKRVTTDRLEITPMNLLVVCKEFLQQISLVEIESEEGKETTSIHNSTSSDPPPIHFGKLLSFDPAETDRQQGVCAIPLYNFSDDEAETFHSGRHIEAAREILLKHGILQYFFPAPDHLALGLADSFTSNSLQIKEFLDRTPDAGHPFGPVEIVDPGIELIDMIAALHEHGLAVEGEFGIEITEKGKSFRKLVRFKPREGLLTRLANLISFKIDITLKDLKDLFNM